MFLAYEQYRKAARQWADPAPAPPLSAQDAAALGANRLRVARNISLARKTSTSGSSPGYGTGSTFAEG